MANNKMFLVYRPTGDAVCVGKRMGWGVVWNPTRSKKKIELLFKKAQEASDNEYSQDDFAIALESGENQPHILDKWTYGETPTDGLVRLIIDPSVSYGKPETI